MAELRVSGTGRATTPPDSATIDFNASHLAPSASEALDRVGEVAAKVVETLDAAGLDPADRGAAHSSVDRRVRWVHERPDQEPQEIMLGWEARVAISCVVRSAGDAFRILETVTEIPDVSAHGPRWQVDLDNPAHDDARQRAVAAARAKAHSYAEAAGLALGELVRLEEGGDPGVSEGMFTMRTASSVADLDPVTQELTATVTLVYEATADPDEGEDD